MSDLFARASHPTSLIVDERSWQNTILELADLKGWYVYHNPDSRRSAPGFPDLCLIRPPRLVFVEVKRETGSLTKKQKDVLSMLTACDVENYVARPSDWQQLVGWLS
jgi:hypothetical protein|tara:strand:+ start:1360 stop:1680 length:321 start_codon:yes stop_codon:yes gene_type:complete